MRIAAISDIHGNALALRAVLDDAKARGYDRMVQIGDALSGPLWPRETADILRGLDAVHVRDIDRDGLAGIGEGFDTIVVGDLLEHLVQPEAALAALHDLSAPGARLVCCLPNGVHASIVERMLAGDFSYDPMGLLDRTHVRLKLVHGTPPAPAMMF